MREEEKTRRAILKKKGEPRGNGKNQENRIMNRGKTRGIKRNLN